MFIVKREGLWLMAYVWLEGSEIPVGLWGVHLNDAKLFERKTEVERIAGLIGKCEIFEAAKRGAR